MLKGSKADEEDDWTETNKDPNKYRAKIMKDVKENPMTDYDVPAGN